MNRKKILLVDDEDAIIFGFKNVLDEPDLIIETAQSLQEATAQIERNCFVGGVVDLHLSHSSTIEGLEVVKLLRKKNDSCKIIILTASDDLAVRYEAMELGADIFLEKPVDPMTVRYIFLSMNIY